MPWRIEHVATTPAGWHVRTIPSGQHELRIAFRPGRRRQGGKLIEILHPLRERNCGCRAKNPGGLVIFGNPGKPNPAELVIFANQPENQPEQDEMSELQQAVKVYQAFHGEDPSEILEAQRSAAMRLNYAAMGPLAGLGLYVEGAPIPSPDHWETYPGAVETGESKIVLACNAVDGGQGETIGTQLYAIGGRQDEFERVAEDLGEDLSKDILDLGPLAFVVYVDSKPPDRQTTEYMHKFDEPRPDLGYDRLKREIFFAGGKYKIEGLWLHH